jgi:hypothetical protein
MRIATAALVMGCQSEQETERMPHLGHADTAIDSGRFHCDAVWLPERSTYLAATSST